MKTLACLSICLLASPAFAEQVLPPFTEALLPMEQELYAVSIGPGGPGEEFGSDATNGGLYRISADGSRTPVELSDGEGLRNPTGLVELNGQIVLVDGNQVISVAPDGRVNWRRSLDADGVFFYDVEALDETTLVVSDFGRGRFVQVSAETGDIKPYLQQTQIAGLARFEIGTEGIYAVSWGSDDAWDSALFHISGSGKSARLVSSGFGNLESVEVIDGAVIIGGYRGHEAFPDTRLMRVGQDGTVQPLSSGSDTQGVSDIVFDGTHVWLTYFYDADYEKVPLSAFGLGQ